ncbi:hypothetical protein L6164_004469 [Bauhinia variegata]|uniref:Uncharacterized protein n=1 Tax=Bauhinia variegata TaxID=167791 RepID=A0ACB9Q3Y7_BAUVA|nr:hypothetical protein L6164_004469 [Bauhinia variegata]
MSMWSNLPFDLLANIFSFLSPDSLARARSACRNWNACALNYPLGPRYAAQSHPPWFLALPIRNHRPCCYAQNPAMAMGKDNWHEISLEFLSVPVRPVAPVESLLLLRVTNSITLQLAICNPFTRQFRYLPRLNISRTNPAVGITVMDSNSFRIYVAGGMSEAGQGGAFYEPTTELYDSKLDTWKIVGSVPVEFAVRLTVWTPNESVYTKGVLYWITSARAYSVIGFELCTNAWFELGVPMADRLEFATLVRRNEVVTLVGGTSGGNACIWELNEGSIWCLLDTVPSELGSRFLQGKTNWGSTKCVGNDNAICLYRDLGSGMVIWREDGDEGRWEWFWAEGCHYIKGKQVQNNPIRGILIHPSLASSFIFD